MCGALILARHCRETVLLGAPQLYIWNRREAPIEGNVPNSSWATVNGESVAERPYDVLGRAICEEPIQEPRDGE